VPLTAGRIVTKGIVENAVSDVLHDWLPWYLQQTCAAEGFRFYDLPQPNGRPTSDNEAPSSASGRKPPYLVVVSPGVQETRRVGRTYRAIFQLGVVAVVTGGDRETTNRRASIYLGSIRTCLLQRGLPESMLVDWVGERTDIFPWDRGMTLVGAQANFLIDVPEVVHLDAGPRPDQPPVIPTGDTPEDVPDHPLVDRIDVDATPRPVEA
jgi:hypothetical protein